MKWPVTAALLVTFLTTATYFGALHLEDSFRLVELGYGDSYILYDILHFRDTGEIYRDLSKPPYLPAQYSPLVYRMFALPEGIGKSNPFLGPRLMAAAAFLACIAMAASLSAALIPVRSAWFWGMCVAASFRCMELWPLQLRGDFAGAFLGLAAIRLLMARFRYSVLFAGLCAGLALQFKITFVAALAAGSLWLLIRRDWGKLAVFLATSTVSTGALYLLFWLHEPRMFSQIFALSPGVWHPIGSFKLLTITLAEPAVLLAVAGLPLILRRTSSRWALLLLYTAATFGFAVLTDMQAGGNVNYFFEGLFALTPITVLGIFQFIHWSRQDTRLALFLSGLVVLMFVLPQLIEIYATRARLNPAAVLLQNESFSRLEAVLRGRHFLSTDPRLALLDPKPALVEPFFMSYQLTQGKFDLGPLLKRVGSGEFELVIAPVAPQYWRGIRHGTDVLDRAIALSYRPLCELWGNLYQLPRNVPEDSKLTKQLTNLGCTPQKVNPSGNGREESATGNVRAHSAQNPGQPPSHRQEIPLAGCRRREDTAVARRQKPHTATV